MNKQGKLLVAIAVVAVVAIGGMWLQNGKLTGEIQTEINKEEITIGAVLPLSGDLAFIGSEIQRGIELAQDELGENSTPVLYEDDESFDLAKAVSATQKLISQHNADVIMTAFVEEAKPIVPVVNEANIPLLVLWDSNAFIREAGENVFSIGFSTEKAGEKMADHAYSNLGLRRVAVVSHLDPWAEIISQSFSDKFEKLGGQVVFSEAVPVEVNDFRTVITKVKSTNPDGVYFPMIPPMITDFIVQATSLGLEAQMLTGDGLVVDAIAAAGSAAEGIYTTNLFTEKEQELTALYQAKYGEDPIDITMVSFGYDGYQTVLQAAGDDESIAQGLQQVLGKDRVADRLERLYQVRDRALVPFTK